MNFEEYPDRDMLIIHVADRLAAELKSCLMSHDFASFAVPGGTTPGPIFDGLCSTQIEWDRVHVMLTDERWVAPDHERSNTRLVRERLLKDHAAKARFVPFWREGLTVGEASEEVSAALVPHMPISVLLLGMGADMHTASLFPGAAGLEQAMSPHAPLACPIHADGQPDARMTLSAQALDGALSKHLVIFGAEKRAAFEKAQSLPAHEAPIGAVMSKGTVHWAE